MRRYHSEEIQVGYTRHSGEPLTIPELQSDDIIVSGLTCAFPEDAVCSKLSVPLPRHSARRVWLVEALDGTHDFIRHGTEACISIGLLVHGRPALGVVFNPMRDELFAGVVGAGATVNGQDARISASRGSPSPRVSSAPETVSFAAAGELGIIFRPVASLAYRLARVAAGLEDGTFTLGSAREYTTCAGTALVLAAGGRVTNHRGLPLTFNSPHLRHSGLVAAGPAFHPVLANLASLLTPADNMPV